MNLLLLIYPETGTADTLLNGLKGCLVPGEQQPCPPDGYRQDPEAFRSPGDHVLVSVTFVLPGSPVCVQQQLSGGGGGGGGAGGRGWFAPRYQPLVTQKAQHEAGSSLSPGEFSFLT